MSISWLLWVLAGTVLVSLVVLAVTCLHCRDRGPLVSIRQANASEDYLPSTQFRIIHPAQLNSDLNSIHRPPDLLSPFSPLSDPGPQRRHRSFTHTETESRPSDENPADGPDYVNDSDAEEPGYIIVLPEGGTNQSRASTPSSDVRHDYENVPKDDLESSDDRDYLNVENFHTSTADLSAQSADDEDDEDDDDYEEDDDEDDDDDDDDDDDEVNYVNVDHGTQ